MSSRIDQGQLGNCVRRTVETVSSLRDRFIWFLFYFILASRGLQQTESSRVSSIRPLVVSHRSLFLQNLHRLLNLHPVFLQFLLLSAGPSPRARQAASDKHITSKTAPHTHLLPPQDARQETVDGKQYIPSIYKDMMYLAFESRNGHHLYAGGSVMQPSPQEPSPCFSCQNGENAQDVEAKSNTKVHSSRRGYPKIPLFSDLH